MYTQLLTFNCNDCGELVADSSTLIKEHDLFNDCLIFESLKVGKNEHELYEHNYSSLKDCTYLEVKCVCGSTIAGLCIKSPPDMHYLKKTYVLDSQNIKSFRVQQDQLNLSDEIKNEIQDIKKDIVIIKNEINNFKEELGNLKSMIFDLNNAVLSNTTEIHRVSQVLSSSN